MEAIFTFLFKYRPLLFREGELVLRPSWPPLLLILLALAAAAVAVASYARAGGKAGRGERIALASLRLGALLVLLLALLRPTLVNTSTVPQKNFVGVLLDDSRSMSLPDRSGEARSAFIPRAFGEGGSLGQGLEDRFAVRYFGFSSGSRRVQGAGDLSYDGTRTDLVAALERAREELSSVPLSGLVVVTDGADNSGRELAEALAPLQAASIPVFAVGLGEETISPDIQVERVSAPRKVLQGTALLLDVLVSHPGFGGSEVTLLVEDQDGLLAEETLPLGPDDEPSRARVRVTLDRPGPRRLRIAVPPQEGERVLLNNERQVEVDVREAREKILYYEGEPRYEVKFLRRALAEDENLQVVVLQRTAEDKYLRLDVDDAGELAGGFPRTREELFRYRGLILGSIEASAFTRDQLAMISDFVAQRGGGLLMLGGPRSFSEGGYQGTAVADALPVVLGEPAQDPHAAFARVRVRPTPAGRGHPVTQIRGSTSLPDAAWDSLPPLSVVNHIRAVKPGAAILMEGRGEGGEEVILAYHRYGRGKAVAFPVVDSWMWQFHALIPVEDRTHEIFWQQLLRWLVDGVPDHLMARVDPEEAEPGEAVRVVAEVNDSVYLGVNDARVEAVVRRPDGTEETVPLRWAMSNDGEYAATFVPPMEGEYEFQLRASGGGGEELGTDRAFLRVGPRKDEYFDAGLREGWLRRLAEETGGRYYRPEEAERLVEDLRFTGAGVTLTEERDLWDMPALFLLLVLMVGGEWLWRKRRGMV